MWYSSQVVRPRSATPLSAGSNPACTSKENGIPFGVPFFFPLDVQALDLNSVPCTFGATESGSHIRLSDRCPLARHRERRDIFTLCVNTRQKLIRHPQGVSFLFWWLRSHFVPTFRRAKRKEFGSHTPLADQGARSLGEEWGYLRRRRIPGRISCGIPYGNAVFSFLWSYSPSLNSVPCTFGATESGPHTPLGDRRACSPGGECGYLHTMCEYPAKPR